jgi:hypothetical protein
MGEGGVDRPKPEHYIKNVSVCRLGLLYDYTILIRFICKCDGVKNACLRV